MKKTENKRFPCNCPLEVTGVEGKNGKSILKLPGLKFNLKLIFRLVFISR